MRIFLDEFVADLCGRLAETICIFNESAIGSAAENFFKIVEYREITAGKTINGLPIVPDGEEFDFFTFGENCF